jgi:hypothetical protein
LNRRREDPALKEIMMRRMRFKVHRKTDQLDTLLLMKEVYKQTDRLSFSASPLTISQIMQLPNFCLSERAL